MRGGASLECAPVPTTDSASAASGAHASDPLSSDPLDSDPLDLLTSTGDHKRLGRVWLVVAVLYLLLGGATGGFLSAERARTGFDVLDADTFGQVFSLHSVSAVFLFLLPAWIGLALILVPLQVGARNIALPRAAAYATWLFVIGGVIVEASYLADGGPGGLDADANELWVLGLGSVLVALLIASTSIVTTVIAARAPGLRLRDVSAFSWSMLIAASLWLLTLPVMVSALVFVWIDTHFGGAAVFEGDMYTPIRWAFGPPQIYLVAIPAIGAAAESLRIASRSPVRPWPALVVGMVGFAALGFGAFATPFAGPDLVENVLFQAQGLALIAPTFIILAAVADIVRQRGGPPRLTSPFLFGAGSVIFLVLGVAAGMTLVTDRLDVGGTVWATAHGHYIGLGAATLGIIAAVHLWSSKVFGAELSDAIGKASFAVTSLGIVLLIVPDIILGADKMPAANPFYGDLAGAPDSWETLSAVSAAGGFLALVGLALFVLNLLSVVGRRRGEVAANPWDADSGLEWQTASPPTPENFQTVPDLTTSRA